MKIDFSFTTKAIIYNLISLHHLLERHHRHAHVIFSVWLFMRTHFEIPCWAITCAYRVAFILYRSSCRAFTRIFLNNFRMLFYDSCLKIYNAHKNVSNSSSMILQKPCLIYHPNAHIICRLIKSLSLLSKNCSHIYDLKESGALWRKKSKKINFKLCAALNFSNLTLFIDSSTLLRI